MPFAQTYSPQEPARTEIDAMRGPMVLEFGASWCGICAAAQPLIQTALADHPQLPHMKIADGPGRPLGRSFKVKLWPTLIFMNDGQEVARVVRPRTVDAIKDAIACTG
ncbi:MAG TPA: thioredoxin family protein [Burkholderiaceae bacterium]|nr:thioredoxin family protein [Burkholderiaceae bacterium]